MDAVGSQQMVAPDSETSVDYYVTTVKDQTRFPKLECDKKPKFVSVDRAGSVKVRKRKKSKRRRKKMNIGLKGGPFLTSDEEVRFQSSDSEGGNHKLPKRSASLCERDLHINKLNSDEDLSKERTTVKRRTKKKNSFKDKRKGVIIENDLPRTNSMSFLNQASHNSPSLPENIEGEKKFVSQKSALATLNAFMEEVKEATTVAKQQDEKKTKDLGARRSRSLSDLHEDSILVETDGGDCHWSNTKRPSFVHKKSDSFGHTSSVFLSEPDISIDETKAASLVLNSSSVESGNEKRSKSLYDLVMATDFVTLTELLVEKVVDKDQPKQPHSNVKLRPDSNYGLTHLEHVCKLMEQIANLRNENQALKQKVVMLEGKLADVGGELGLNETSHTIAPFPRSKQVVKLKEDKPFQRIPSVVEQNSTRANDPGHGGLDNSLSSNGFGAIPSDRPVIYSNISLRKKRRPYSRDDLDLSAKGRWKFWKAPVNKLEKSNSKKHIVTTIKSEHTQGSAIHLKSASVTLDSLLNNIDDEFSQKMMQWQGAGKTSRAPSRASVASNDTAMWNVSSKVVNNDEENVKLSNSTKNSSGEIQSKPSLKKRFSRWEKAARKLSWHGDYRRSKSMDRMDDVGVQTYEDSAPLHPSTKIAKDFYKSMPCVMIDGERVESETTDLSNGERINPNLTEWSAVQEAFPTNKSSISDPIRRFISSSQSRLAAPLRKKSNKRRSWSFTKRPPSKYFLPTSGDFVSMENNIHTTDQYTLELDNEDVKTIGVNDKELQYLKNNTAHLREKLKTMEKEHVPESSQKSSHGVNPRPASSLARYNHERNVHSFPHSNIGVIHRPSLCKPGLASMTPLQEEPLETSDVQSNSKNFYKSRRHTFSGLDFCIDDDETDSALPNSQEHFGAEALITPVVSYLSQRVSTLKKNEIKTKDESISKTSESSLESIPFKQKDSEKSTPKKHIGEKLLSQIGKLSSKSLKFKTSKKSAENNSQESIDTKQSSSEKVTKKRQTVLKSFSAKSKKPTVLISSVDGSPNIGTEAKPKQSLKIAEISQRLSISSERSRTSSNQSMGPSMKKGLVHRLSQRFMRGGVKEKSPTHSSVKTRPRNISATDSLSENLNASNNNNKCLSAQGRQ